MTTAFSQADTLIENVSAAKFAQPSSGYTYGFGIIRQMPTTVTTAAALEPDFRQLVMQWREETQFYSSVTDIILHPAYQQIIGKGVAIVPLILREIEAHGADHWYWALGAITQENPAEDAPQGDIVAICQAWLNWGRRRGIVAK